MTTSDIAMLAARAARLNRAWRLRLCDEGIELTGNGPRAVFRTLTACEDWLAYQEKGNAR